MNNTGEWWDWENALIILTAHLASHGYTAQQVADAVAYPWKYEKEFRVAYTSSRPQ